jgi:DNA repair exonuclease SbcCD ATPase subunit
LQRAKEDSRVTQEPPLVPGEPARENAPTDAGESTEHDRIERVRDSLKRLSESRLRQGASMQELEERVSELRGHLAEVISEEKDLRITRARLNAERERLRAAVIDLSKDRMKKDSIISSYRSRLAGLRMQERDGGHGEIERLEDRIERLQGDVDAFTETLLMHRRDRDRVFKLLVDAMSHLQDKLTENVLWKILAIESEAEGEQGRSGVAGVSAELLGRLLVLEKEESQLSGLVSRMRSSLEPGSGSGETARGTDGE